MTLDPLLQRKVTATLFELRGPVIHPPLASKPTDKDHRSTSRIDLIHANLVRRIDSLNRAILATQGKYPNPRHISWSFDHQGNLEVYTEPKGRGIVSAARKSLLAPLPSEEAYQALPPDIRTKFERTLLSVKRNTSLEKRLEKIRTMRILLTRGGMDLGKSLPIVRPALVSQVEAVMASYNGLQRWLKSTLVRIPPTTQDPRLRLTREVLSCAYSLVKAPVDSLCGELQGVAAIVTGEHVARDDSGKLSFESKVSLSKLASDLLDISELFGPTYNTPLVELIITATAMLHDPLYAQEQESDRPARRAELVSWLDGRNVAGDPAAAELGRKNEEYLLKLMLIEDQLGGRDRTLGIIRDELAKVPAASLIQRIVGREYLESMAEFLTELFALQEKKGAAFAEKLKLIVPPVVTADPAVSLPQETPTPAPVLTPPQAKSTDIIDVSTWSLRMGASRSLPPLTASYLGLGSFYKKDAVVALITSLRDSYGEYVVPWAQRLIAQHGLNDLNKCINNTNIQTVARFASSLEEIARCLTQQRVELKEIGFMTSLACSIWASGFIEHGREASVRGRALVEESTCKFMLDMMGSRRASAADISNASAAIKERFDLGLILLQELQLVGFFEGDETTLQQLRDTKHAHNISAMLHFVEGRKCRGVIPLPLGSI
jgi:hypothetical protein